MTTLALRHTHGIMVHRHTGPVWIMVTRFTTAQTGMVRGRGFIGGMTARHTTAGHDQTVINRGTDKRRCGRVTDRTVLTAGHTGMQLIRRCGHGITTTDMAGAALGGTSGIMIHPYIVPARIAMTILTADQARMATGPGLVTGMTTGGLATRCNTRMIQQRSTGKAPGTAMTHTTIGAHQLRMHQVIRRGPAAAARCMATQTVRANTHVLKLCRRPARCFMASITFQSLTHQVHGIFWRQRCTNTGATGMTGTALTGGALKHTRHMTGFTVDTSMQTGQRKASGHMVKCLNGWCSRPGR